MTKIPYELITIEADKLITKMVSCPFDRAHQTYVTYLLYINACGWSEQEFNNATLARIDTSWDDKSKFN